MAVVSTLIAVGVLVLGVASCFAVSAAELAVSAVSPQRVRRLRETSARGAAALDSLAERPSHLGAAHALVAGLTFAAAASACAWTLQTVWLGVPVWTDAALSVVIGAAIVFMLGEALPRAMVTANPEDVGLAVAPAARLVTAVFYPIARALSAPWTAATRLITGERGPDVPWAELGDGYRAGDDESQTSEEAEAILDAVAGLEDKVAREVMVPRTDMIAIEDTASLSEALAAITAAGVSRVPVYHDTLDDIRGILYAKDLLPALAEPKAGVRPADLVRPALFVPETKPVDELLREMRRRTHIAIVADEYGGTAGLVTIEDLLEEIVGEIYDEYDPQVAMVTTLPDGRVRMDARMSIDDLDELFGTALEVDGDTAGGLFTELAGHIPQAGESVEVQGLRFTVEKMEGNRVRQLVVEPVPPREDEEPRA
jgi:CBS domain containing-hemolysin-like protein